MRIIQLSGRVIVWSPKGEHPKMTLSTQSQPIPRQHSPQSIRYGLCRVIHFFQHQAPKSIRISDLAQGNGQEWLLLVIRHLLSPRPDGQKKRRAVSSRQTDRTQEGSMSHMRLPGMRAGRTKGGDTIAKPDHPAVGNSDASALTRNSVPSLGSSLTLWRPSGADCQASHRSVA